MTVGEKLFENLLTVGILGSLIVIVYCRMTGKTLIDLLVGIKEMIFGGTEEVIEVAQGGFESIR